jgi:two-component system CheB/CheR fusion protein
VLSRATTIPVYVITDGMPVEPERVYVIPPNATMTLRAGRFVLTTREPGGPHLPIDRFFESLAQEQGDRAIGIVLSGAGSDGTLGLKAIRAEGGITFVQDETSAKYAGMPHSALELADFVLPPREIAQELSRITRHPYVAPSPAPEPSEGPTEENGILAVARILRRATGVDFTQYKPGTLQRRIARRQVMTKIDRLDEYVRHLRRTPDEVQALYADVLIPVTRFFRDPEVFDALKQLVFPRLIEGREPDDPIRIWVPACSTGEEVYSIVICLLEYLESAHVILPIQLFGTDVSHTAIARARAGTFPSGIEHEISPLRLRRYFTRVDGVYQVSRVIRESCVFAAQDLTRDPPFSRLDLISCCNVLIYFNTALQERMIPIFHHALKPNGFLRMGRSESVGRLTSLFSLLDRKHKIYRREPGPGLAPGFGLTAGERFAATALQDRAPATPPQSTGWSRAAIEHEADRLVLGRFAPAGVVVNADFEIVQFRGKTGLFFEAPSGVASFNLFRMTREELQLPLRNLMQQVAKTGAPAVAEGVQLKTRGETRQVIMEVLPVGPPKGAKGRHYLVLLMDTPTTYAVSAAAAEPVRRQRTTARAQEIEALRQQVATMREEYEAVIEELSAASEEAQSSNEELQSTNEELETAKEELQATNEELTTVNDELASRHADLGQLSNDLLNLLASVQMPILMIGTDLRLRRMTPVSERILGIAPTDIGRPLGDLRISADIPDLESVVRNVIDSLAVQEREVKARDGRWYAMRVRPYRTADHKIDGVVISLVDIDALRRGLSEVEAARAEAEKATQAKDRFLAILSHELRTPLQAMLGWIRLLRAGTLSEADTDRALEVIERNTLLQSRMISDLLDVSRIAAGRLRLEMRPMRLAPAIQSAIATMGPVAEAKGVTLDTALHDNADWVLGEPARMQQIVVNLLGNAIKFTPPHGRVKVQLVNGPDHVELIIRDTGVGIAPQDLPAIFDQFGHTDPNRAAGGGMGVGLAIVKHLVELQGGSVRAESLGPDQGSTFTVTLPRTNQRPLAAEEQIARDRAAATPSNLQGTRVLVVDDEADTRILLDTILTAAGAEVVQAPDAQRALERLQQERFDMLVSDIMMPVEDGHGLMKKVRALGPERNGLIPAIALTALAGMTDGSAAIDAGYDRHMSKPVEPAALVAAVAALLQHAPGTGGSRADL